MKRPSNTIALLAAALVLALLGPSGAAAATAGASETPAAGTTAAAAESDDKPSAAERRAADSEFEREKLDQGAFANGDEKAADDEAGSSGSGSALRSILSLLVVLAIIFGIHRLLKMWGQSKLQGVSGKAGIIDVVATTSLAQGRALHLVRVGEELVLVGATEQSITRIGDFDAGRIGAQAAGGGDSSGFQAMLNGAMLGNQPGVPKGMGGAGTARDPFLRRFLDNLRLSTAR